MRGTTLFASLSFVLCIAPAAAAGLPEASVYRGEIRRDANGQLVAVPAEPTPSATPTQSKPLENSSQPEKNPATGEKKKTGKPAEPAATPSMAATPEPQTIHVGPIQQFRTIAAASKYARDGDTIEIDSGDYVSDVAVWKQNRLTIRGIGPTRPRLIANGSSAEGKGIWVMRGNAVTVENLEFSGARVPDKNGAGIRFEQGQLSIKNCRFVDNENGILSAAGEGMQLLIENSEFGHNGAGDGRSHNIYVGNIQKLTVIGSYFHHAKSGHLLKSRAAENHILYNRLTDEIDGHASYELEFPNGGIAYVIGNIIEQGPLTENNNIISFGAEGFKYPSNELYLINNTIADDRPAGGNILALPNGVKKLVILNNLLVTRNKLNANLPGQIANNPNVNWDQLAGATRYDYRLKSNSPLLGKYVMPSAANGVNLIPQREYHHPAGSTSLKNRVQAPGALQSLAAP